MRDPFASARRIPSIFGEVYESASLDDEAIGAMWRLRSSLVELREGRQESAEFQAFGAAIREGAFTSILRREGRLVSMGTWVLRRREAGGRPFTFLLVKGLYVAPDARGSSRNALLTLEGMVRVLGRHGAVWAGGPVLLPGFLALHRLGSEVWLAGEMPPAAGAVYRALAPDFPALDRDTGTVHESFHTSERAPRRPSDPRLAAAYDRFLSRYPRWQEGDHGFALTRFDLGTFARLVREGLTRRRRPR
jgi:hypothetical protein